ncbi:MAG: 4-hydroxythreonine-4-phosphate dehydrogenase PdxA [Maricaulaceae bacterium]
MVARFASGLDRGHSPLIAPLAVSSGDPAGVGPEIALKAWAARRTTGPCFLIVGDPATFEAEARRLDLPRPALVSDPGAAAAVFPTAPALLPQACAAAVRPGTPDPANAPAVVKAISRAVDLTLRGETAGVVTAPISKSVLYQDGFAFPGHTEYLAELCKDAAGWPDPRGPVMMLTASGLRVALVTIHTPLALAPALVTPDRVERVIRVTADALTRDFGVTAPRLALCGLNPHAGEDGALGSEEREVLNPLAERLRTDGVQISDALPADTLFHAEARAGYDAAIAMYHDQGLIPVKTLDFWAGVNVTLGLPIVRTSPDHGTGFDIAGRGIARADSLIAALDLAAVMARARARHEP